MGGEGGARRFTGYVRIAREMAKTQAKSIRGDSCYTLCDLGAAIKQINRKNVPSYLLRVLNEFDRTKGVTFYTTPVSAFLPRASYLFRKSFLVKTLRCGKIINVKPWNSWKVL